MFNKYEDILQSYYGRHAKYVDEIRNVIDVCVAILTDVDQCLYL